jgi:hypothetical protein
MACLVACETALQDKAATDARIAETARQATSAGKQDRPFGNSGHGRSLKSDHVRDNQTEVDRSMGKRSYEPKQSVAYDRDRAVPHKASLMRAATHVPMCSQPANARRAPLQGCDTISMTA